MRPLRDSGRGGGRGGGVSKAASDGLPVSPRDGVEGAALPVSKRKTLNNSRSDISGDGPPSITIDVFWYLMVKVEMLRCCPCVLHVHGSQSRP